MNPSLLLACASLTLTACNSRGAPATVTSAGRTEIACDAAWAVDHPWFPLQPGAQWTYAGHDGGLRIREDVAVQPAVEIVAGTRCLVMVQQRFVADELDETTFHFYSGDAAGRLWVFGEVTQDASGAVIETDSWLAGRDGAAPVPWLPRLPAAGDRYELAFPHGTEAAVVVGLDAMAEVPAGTFADCLEIQENPESTDGDLVLYARGVGRVLEQGGTGRLLLIDHR